MKTIIQLTIDEASNLIKQSHNADEVQITSETPRIVNNQSQSITELIYYIKNNIRVDCSNKIELIKYVRECYAAKHMYIGLADAKQFVEYVIEH